MKQPKRTVSGGMRVRAYDVLRRAVEEGSSTAGAALTSTPTGRTPMPSRTRSSPASLNQVCEYFAFDEEEVR